MPVTVNRKYGYGWDPYFTFSHTLFPSSAGRPPRLFCIFRFILHTTTMRFCIFLALLLGLLRVQAVPVELDERTKTTRSPANKPAKCPVKAPPPVVHPEPATRQAVSLCPRFKSCTACSTSSSSPRLVPISFHSHLQLQAEAKRKSPAAGPKPLQPTVNVSLPSKTAPL
ncbi:hypothetical protein C8R45DRAFT_1003011 [Mycena sanguinolenta]|nr:hypothetical protein C8R45DRAFT_1003011 [Mycena sanguinolenta]